MKPYRTFIHEASGLTVTLSRDTLRYRAEVSDSADRPLAEQTWTTHEWRGHCDGQIELLPNLIARAVLVANQQDEQLARRLEAERDRLVAALVARTSVEIEGTVLSGNPYHLDGSLTAAIKRREAQIAGIRAALATRRAA